MLTDEEKRFFLYTANGARGLSGCPTKHGAVLARKGRILSHGHNRRLIPDKDWEVSAIYDAIFCARDIDLTGSMIFSTCFPSLDDMKLILAVGISDLYFTGKIDHPDAVHLLNSLGDSSNRLETHKLEMQ